MKTDCVKAFPHERTREDTVEIIETKILDDSSESESFNAVNGIFESVALREIEVREN